MGFLISHQRNAGLMVAHYGKKLGFRTFDSNGCTVTRTLPGYLPGASGHSFTFGLRRI